MTRGNARLHWAPKARHVADMRETGVDEGVLYKRARPGEDFPILGPLLLEVEAWTPTHVDGDNLLIGYKGFLDGLGEGTRVHPGAGVIHDDRQIIDWRIRMRRGNPRTLITLTVVDDG